MRNTNNFKKKINLNKTKIGKERREMYQKNILKDKSFLPSSVTLVDMDISVMEFVKDKFDIKIGDKVPFIIDEFMTAQSWSEFSSTWNNSDNKGKIKIPFVSVQRETNPQVGEQMGGFYNIPGMRTYTIYKVPTFDGNREGVDLYKVPQGVAVNVTYLVRVYTNRLSDLNEFSQMMHETFQSRQYYVYPQKHPMPLLMESIEDESTINEIDKRRYYVQTFELVLEGYIMNVENIGTEASVSRMNLFTSIDTAKCRIKPRYENVGDERINQYILDFDKGASNSITYSVTKPQEIFKITDLYNIHKYEILINGVKEQLPYSVSSNDDITINIEREISQNNSSITIEGRLL